MFVSPWVQCFETFVDSLQIVVPSYLRKTHFLFYKRFFFKVFTMRGLRVLNWPLPSLRILTDCRTSNKNFQCSFFCRHQLDQTKLPQGPRERLSHFLNMHLFYSLRFYNLTDLSSNLSNMWIWNWSSRYFYLR